jgi:AcrR family transcriptional regulator
VRTTVASPPAAGAAVRGKHKQRTGHEPLASARTLFAKRGYRATSPADIAAGVTERTLFRYFPNKIPLGSRRGHRPAVGDGRALR